MQPNRPNVRVAYCTSATTRHATQGCAIPHGAQEQRLRRGRSNASSKPKSSLPPRSRTVRSCLPHSRSRPAHACRSAHACRPATSQILRLQGHHLCHVELEASHSCHETKSYSTIALVVYMHILSQYGGPCCMAETGLGRMANPPRAGCDV